MHQVLVPIDSDSDRALAQVSFVTALPMRPEQVTIVLAHAVANDGRGPEDDPIAALGSLFQWQPTQEAATEAQADQKPEPHRISSVLEAAKHLDESGYEFSVEEISHPVDEGIVSLAAELDVDHIVMGGRKRSPAGKVVFGSITHSVLTETDKPLTVTGDDHHVDAA